MYKAFRQFLWNYFGINWWQKVPGFGFYYSKFRKSRFTREYQGLYDSTGLGRMDSWYTIDEKDILTDLNNLVGDHK